MEVIDKDGFILTLGRELIKFPLEPSYGKALLAARYLSRECESDCAKLLSILSTENIWQGVSRFDQKRKDKLEDVKYSFRNPESDHMAIIEIFDQWRQKYAKSTQAANDWAFRNLLQNRALTTADSIYRQLKD